MRSTPGAAVRSRVLYIVVRDDCRGRYSGSEEGGGEACHEGASHPHVDRRDAEKARFVKRSMRDGRKKWWGGTERLVYTSPSYIFCMVGSFRCQACEISGKLI